MISCVFLISWKKISKIWVKGVSKILGISENKGGWRMKRNMLDFYNEKCWKRNAPII